MNTDLDSIHLALFAGYLALLCSLLVIIGLMQSYLPRLHASSESSLRKSSESQRLLIFYNRLIVRAVYYAICAVYEVVANVECLPCWSIWLSIGLFVIGLALYLGLFFKIRKLL
ncbi:MAG: hypothetical protein PHR28_00035 [candidate division Zixibacteria bacterium]|nr:hypothetical protein [candidate division Zixibacteria bacterium]